MKALSRLIPALLIAVALDGLTKAYAQQVLIYDDPVPVVGEVLRLTLGYNTGVAFGVFAGTGPWSLIITSGVVIALVAWLVKALLGGKLPLVASWPAGLLLGGAISNLADRLPDGRVTDFLDVGLGATRWPAFNLADSFVVLGIIAIAGVTWLGKQPREPNQ